MKLNKPKVTDTQTELEDYVSSLLVDSPNQTDQQELNAKKEKYEKSPDSNLLDKERELKEFRNDTLNDNVSQITQDNFSEKKSAQKLQQNEVTETVFSTQDIPVDVEHPVKLNTRLNKTKGDVIPLTKRNENNKVIESVEVDSPVEKTNTPEKQKTDEQKSDEKAGRSINKVVNKGSPSKTSIEPSEERHLAKVNQEITDYSKRSYKEPAQTDPRLKNVEKLLTKIALANVTLPDAKTGQLTESKTTTAIESKEKVVTEAVTITPPESKHEEGITSKDIEMVDVEPITLESVKPSFEHRQNTSLKDHLGDVFQTLVFDVNQLPLAVPLIKLGGIVNVRQMEVTPLVGTPDWFMGLVPNERGNLMVIDTQKFLMPERPNAEDKEYQYLIILDDSQWALACHSVGDAKNLTPDDIRWSSGSSKRPWFAGMVVEYMSALIEVDKLINLLAENVVD